MLAQVPQLDSLAERIANRPGQHDLPAVGDGTDASGTVHLQTDVALASQRDNSRMQAHADADGGPGQRSLAVNCGGDRSGWVLEHHEEGVALGVDLDAAVGGKGLAQQPAVLRQHTNIPVTELAAAWWSPRCR